MSTWAEGPIQADAGRKAVLDLLIRVQGLAAASPLPLRAEILVLPPDRRAKPGVARAGLDPRQSLSGTSVHQPPRLSRAGNRSRPRALSRPA
jgi:hypothetical protein